jgi:hypothetical protein
MESGAVVGSAERTGCFCIYSKKVVHSVSLVATRGQEGRFSFSFSFLSLPGSPDYAACISLSAGKAAWILKDLGRDDDFLRCLRGGTTTRSARSLES